MKKSKVIEAAIEEMKAEVEKGERRILHLKRLINSVVIEDGLLPMFYDVPPYGDADPTPATTPADDKPAPKRRMGRRAMIDDEKAYDLFYKWNNAGRPSLRSFVRGMDMSYNTILRCAKKYKWAAKEGGREGDPAPEPKKKKLSPEQNERVKAALKRIKDKGEGDDPLGSGDKIV